MGDGWSLQQRLDGKLFAGLQAKYATKPHLPPGGEYTIISDTDWALNKTARGGPTVPSLNSNWPAKNLLFHLMFVPAVLLINASGLQYEREFPH